jgi:hypothetical protein
MTIKEFQQKYHDYSTKDEHAAVLEAMKLKVVDENGKVERVFPIKLGDKYCLMLEKAARALEDMGVI